MRALTVTLLTTTREVFTLLTPERRQQAVWIVAGQILAAIVETLAMASLVPFLAIL